MYAVSYQDKSVKLFKIEGPNPPPYFAKGCRQAGMELAHLEIKDDDISYKLEPVDQHLIRGFIHANRVLNRLGHKPRSKSIDSTVQST